MARRDPQAVLSGSHADSPLKREELDPTDQSLEPAALRAGRLEDPWK